jgi:hypothetical protein
LLDALDGNQAAMDGFVRVNAAVSSPGEFFADENVSKILTTSR